MEKNKNSEVTNTPENTSKDEYWYRKQLHLYKRRTTILTVILTATILTCLVLISMTNIKNNYMDKTYGEIDFVRRTIYENYYKDVDQSELDIKLIDTLFETLGDSYSFYKDPVEYKNLKSSLNSKPIGIGVKITYDEGYVIEYIYPKSPAHKAGLKPGDIIIKINETDTLEYIGNPFEIMPKEKGDTIQLTILRDNEQLEVATEIDHIKVETVKSEVIDGVGYISITEFNFGTHKEFKKHLSELQKSNITGLLVDVRNNVGGSVSDIAKILGYLGITDTVVTLKYRDDLTLDYNSKGTKLDTPIVVLTNEYTASSSEIIAYNLQYAGHTVVGTQSYGKGVAQNMIENRTGSGGY